MAINEGEREREIMRVVVVSAAAFLKSLTPSSSSTSNYSKKNKDNAFAGYSKAMHCIYVPPGMGGSCSTWATRTSRGHVTVPLYFMPRSAVLAPSALVSTPVVSAKIFNSVFMIYM